MINPIDYEHRDDGQIVVTVATSDEERSHAVFVGDYEIVPVEEDRFCYGLSSHYTETVGYWVTFSVTSAHYTDDDGHETEEFDYDAQDIDAIDYYLNDIFKQDGDL